MSRYFLAIIEQYFHWNRLKVNALSLFQKYKHQLLSVPFQTTYTFSHTHTHTHKKALTYIACLGFVLFYALYITIYDIWEHISHTKICNHPKYIQVNLAASF